MSKDSIPLNPFVNDAERIAANADSVASKVYASKKLSKFFKIEVKLYIFDHFIRSWIFPSKD